MVVILAVVIPIFNNKNIAECHARVKAKGIFIALKGISNVCFYERKNSEYDKRDNFDVAIADMTDQMAKGEGNLFFL